MSETSRGPESSSAPDPTDASNAETHELRRRDPGVGAEVPMLGAESVRGETLPRGRTEQPLPATSHPEEQSTKPTDSTAPPSNQSPDPVADALWADFVNAFESFGTLTLRAEEGLYNGIQTIARLWRYHAGHMSGLLASKGIKRAPNAKSEVQPLVKFGLRKRRDSSGWATKITVALDEWAKADPPIPVDQLPDWLTSKGGVNEVYKAVRARRQPRLTKEECDAAFHHLVEVGYAWVAEMPEQFVGLDGDYLALVHFDSIRRTIGFRAIDPKVDQGWLRRNAKRLLASRSTLDGPPAPPRSDVPLDPFMTDPKVAKHLYEVTKAKTAHIAITRWLEPSVGAGAFFNLLPADQRLGIDINKRLEGVIEHDFLTFTEFGDYVYGTIGNFPFGKDAPVKFFNHAARVSRFIAVIVPTTFRKASTVNKLDPNFHLIHEEDLPENSFIFEGQEEHIPAIFQIWERRATKREPIPELPAETADLEFLPDARSGEATIWFQCLGVNAGRIKDPNDILTKSRSPNSHLFIRCDPTAANILRSISWREIRQKGSGPPTITQTEIVEAYRLAKSKSPNTSRPTFE